MKNRNFLLFLSIVFILLFCDVVLADWTIDNVKSYDKKIEKITIYNWNFIGKIFDIKLAEYKLDYNTYKCLTNCEARGTAILYTNGYLFTNMKFEDLGGKEKEIPYTIYLNTNLSYQVTVNEYGKEICEEKVTANGTQEICGMELLGNHIETIERWTYIPYEGQILSEGTYEWKLEGTKNIGEDIDWIGSAFGEDLSEWAVWAGGAAWQYKNCFTVTNNDPIELANVTLNRTFDTATLITAGKMESGCEDLRVIDDDIGEEIAFNFTDQTCDDANTDIFFNVPNWSAGETQSICYYYGNSGASGGGDDWRNVYMEYDDFNDGDTLDTNKWVRNGANMIVTNGVLQIFGTTATDNVTSLRTWSEPIQIDADILINFAESDGDSAYFSHGELVDDNYTQMIVSGFTNEHMILINKIDGSISQQFNLGTMADDTRYNITLTINSTTSEVFIDRVLDVQNVSRLETVDAKPVQIYPFDTIDVNVTEIIISRFISAEPTYSAFGGEESTSTPMEVNVTLNTPTDNSNTQSTSVLFNGTFIVTNGNFTNTTIFVWRSDGTELATNFTLINGTINSTKLAINNLSVGTGFQWNYFACARNVTSSICKFAISNFTLDVVPFTEVATSFNRDIDETSRQSFTLDITTLPSILTVSSKLNYNNTKHNADTTCTSGSCIISTDIDIPLVSSGESENKSFFWEIAVFDGTSSFNFNSTTNQQNVSRIHLEECNATWPTETLNFTTYDEQNLSKLNPFQFDGFFDYWLGFGTVKRNKSFSKNVTEMTLCLDPNVTISTDAIINYDEVGNGTLYTNRFYYFDNHSINNVSQEIKMYLLKSASSTSFILKVQDENLLPVVDAIIEIHRFYPGEGVFKIVQIAKTDDNGKSIGFFETETVDYKFIIKKLGVTLLETGQQKVIPETSPFTLTFNIGTDLGEPWTSQDEIEDLESTLTWDEDTGIVTYTYIDSSGSFTQARLLVQEQSLTNISAYRTICNDTVAISSATMTCTVGNDTGFYIASSFITRAAEGLDLQISFKIEDFSSVVGILGLFFGWFLILIASFMFKFNEIAGIWSTTITIFLVNLMGLVNFGAVFVSAIIGIAIILTWVMEK